jgi:Trp operon repressor
MSKPLQEHHIDLPAELIEELLTDSELRMVRQRLLILRLLSEGKTIRAIAEQVGVGTDTVVRMSKKMESNPKLKEIYEKHSGQIPSSSKWVFGEVSSEEKF